MKKFIALIVSVCAIYVFVHSCSTNYSMAPIKDLDAASDKSLTIEDCATLNSNEQ